MEDREDIRARAREALDRAVSEYVAAFDEVRGEPLVVAGWVVGVHAQSLETYEMNRLLVESKPYMNVFAQRGLAEVTAETFADVLTDDEDDD